MDASKMKIKILKNGPYLVTGNVPLSEKIIDPKGMEYEWKEGRPLPQSEQYILCRCGKSKNPPFCDGAHVKAHFKGEETAKNDRFEDRAEVFEGPDLDLWDDHRCAFARFCHQKHGDAWELIEHSDDPRLREEAIQAAVTCPAGRLEIHTKSGEVLEPHLAPGIEVIEDPERSCSGGLYVKGGIPIESANGELYECRNRVVLCRCGRSGIMPFCDATHTTSSFSGFFSFLR